MYAGRRGLELPDEFVTALLLHLADLGAHQYCSGGISAGRKAAGALQYGTQLFTFLNPICSGIGDLALQSHRDSDVVPSRQLMDGQHVSRLQRHVSTRILILNRPADVDGGPMAYYLLSVLDVVAGEVGRIQQGTAFETACHANKLRGRQSFGQRVFPRAANLTVNGDVGSISLITAEESHGIECLQMHRARCRLELAED